MKYLRFVFPSLLMAFVFAPSLYAQTSRTIPNIESMLGFGGAVAISGSEVYAGSRLMGNPRGEEPPGKVSIFKKNGDGDWNLSGTLSASDGIVGDQFGNTLVKGGTTLAVNAPGQNGKSGAVYVFEQDDSGAWTETGKLSIDTSTPEDQFGVQVAVKGDFVLVAAPRRDQNTGVVYAFHKNNGEWTLHSEIQGDDTEQGDALVRPWFRTVHM